MTATLEEAPAYTAPWQGLGTDVSKSKTVADALKKSGLNWTVTKEPAFRANGKAVPGHFFTTRDSDDMVLGSVGAPYVVFQNHELFGFADGMLKDGSIELVSALPLRGGKVVALNFKLPEGIMVGGEDRTDLYIVISTSHDGSRGLNCMATPIRVICMNTLIMAKAQAEMQWSLTHTTTLQGRAVEAAKTLQLTSKYADAYKLEAEKLMSIKLTDKKFDQLLDEVIPVTSKVDEVLETIKSLYKTSPRNGYTGTAWGAINAVTEYYDHGRDTRSQEALFYQVTRGKVAAIRSNLESRLLAVA